MLPTTPVAIQKLFFVFLLLSSIISSSPAHHVSEFQTLSSVTQTFLSLISRPSTSIQQFSKLAKSINLDPPDQDDKIVANLIHTAAECKTLLELSQNPSLLSIGSDVSVLEQQLPVLERIVTKIPTTNQTASTLINTLSHLKSNANSFSTPEFLTLNLATTYVCLATRFLSSSTCDPPTSHKTDTVLSETCGQALDQLQSQILNSAMAIQSTDTAFQETAPLQHHIKTLSLSQVTLVNSETSGNHYKTSSYNLRNIINSAKSMESLISALKSKVESRLTAGSNEQANLTKLHSFVSYYEFIDARLSPLNVTKLSKFEQESTKLRNLRTRLYNGIESLLHSGITFDNAVVSNTVKELTSTSIKTACLLNQPNPKPLETQFAQQSFIKLSNKLANRITELNLGNVSSTQVNDPQLKTLAILAEQVIKSSLIKTENNIMLNKQKNMLTSSRVKSYTFTLTESTSCYPDNYVQPCYLINGQYPGPSIVVNQHDFLRITVNNKMTVATTLHFHGILQTYTVASDGVPHVTQDLIMPNGSYVYEMHIGKQSGTFMYHGHVGLDLVWLHGPLIIKDNAENWKVLGPKFAYDYEHTFMLEEIFHKSFEDLITGMKEEGIDDPPVSSFAINGKSFGNWSENQGSAEGYEVLTVDPGKTYRFRVINMGAGSMLQFTIENHNMTVIEMDGVVTEPVVTDRLELHTGQRYSVLVTMDKGVGNYWVQARLMGEEGGADNGRAILAYSSGCNENDVAEMKTWVFGGVSDPVEISENGWILNELMPHGTYRQAGVYDFPVKSDRKVWIDMQFTMVEGKPRYLINGNLFKEPEIAYLESVRAGKYPENDTHVIPVREGEVIDIVFQNRYDHTGGCDEHPIHLHGHSFWVVASGADEVDLSTIDNLLNVEAGNRRQFRDTFTLFPNSTVESEELGVGCGWAVVRFVADNPGLWFVHCHVTSHMILGKSFVLYEYSSRNPKLLNE